jgi:(5-formylfuran-3-yl)methyl phosphate synthase
MRLLVSVRSAVEVAAAVAGGADIIDAKEPSLGSLGAVSPATLRAIARALPPALPLSVALGDHCDAASVAGAFAALVGIGSHARETYLKLGLASMRDVTGAASVITAAVEAAARVAGSPAVIVVAYADHAAAEAPPRDVVRRLAAAAGARGVLLDTCVKDGRDLFHHVGRPELRRWVIDAKRDGLLVALAGSLSAEAVERISDLPGDVIGVRGAACAGGREGSVTEDRVRRLRSLLDRPASRPPVAV